MPATPSDAPLRSPTVPTKLIPGDHNADSSDSLDEILFYHPSAKIVHFAPMGPVQPKSNPLSADLDYPVDTIETLSWRSSTERTVAFAPLKLEKVPGLTAFLKCGNVVHAILRNSQCWCVDGESIFVLRIRPLTYYRIELPNETEEDKERVLEMKQTLPRILRYEVTPCPFQRGFSVPIPEAATAPRRKKAWRPKGRRDSAPTISATVVEWQEKIDAPIRYASTDVDTDGDMTDDSGFTLDGPGSRRSSLASHDGSSAAPIEIPSDPRSPKRPVSRGQQVTTLLARFEPIPESESEAEGSSLSSSLDSFHSFQSTSLVPPSPSYSNPPLSPTSRNPPEPASPHHNREFSEITVTPQFLSWESPTAPGFFNDSGADLESPTSPPHRTSEQNHDSSPAHLPAQETSGSPATDDPAEGSDVDRIGRNSEVLRRFRASRQRDLSPMPPPSTLFHPTPRDSGHHLTASILQKTCSIVLVPPIQFMMTLLQLAARIAVGHTDDSAVGESTQKQGYSFGRMDEEEDSEDDLDDFGVPITDFSRRKSGYQDPWDLD
ncbi:hypothetical protein VTN02DRAFT_2548 [Thermoascus thermophilus]